MKDKERAYIEGWLSSDVEFKKRMNDKINFKQMSDSTPQGLW